MMKVKLNNRRSLMIAGSLAALLAATPCLGQAPMEQDAASTASTTAGVAEILVTARKREERLQQAPLAITAVSGDTLLAKGITSVDQLGSFVPNATFVRGVASLGMLVTSIRGIATFDPLLTRDSSIGMYIDGVYIARAVANVVNMTDIERVEVLRGPQGTLFGRNTTGGAISIVTRKPSDDFGLSQTVTYASNNQWDTTSILNTGKIGATGISAKFIYAHRQHDGFQRHLDFGDERGSGASNVNAFSAMLKADIAPGLSAIYSFDYSKEHQINYYSQIAAIGADQLKYFSQSPDFGGVPFVVSLPRLGALRQLNTETGSSQTMKGHALTIEYKASDALTLKSISAYRKLRLNDIPASNGNGPLRGPVVTNFDPFTVEIQDVAPFNLPPHPGSPKGQHQYSEELQAIGTIGRVDYVLGAFYFGEHVHETQRGFLTFVLPGGDLGINIRPTIRYSGRQRSYAGFGQLSYRPAILGDSISITGGLRYTVDKRSILWTPDTNGIPDGPPLADRKSFRNLSGDLTVNGQITPDIMAYGKFSKAYTAGGFNGRLRGNSYNPEKATAFEMGLKSEWFDRRLRFNAAVFQTKYKDLQIPLFISSEAGAVSTTANAGAATFRGVELEINAVPLEGIQLDASFGYVNPKYDRFDFITPAGVIDVSDQAKFSYVSKITAHLGAQYRTPETGLGVVTLRADYDYRSGYYEHPLREVGGVLLSPFRDIIKANARNTLNGRISLSQIPLNVDGVEFEVALWGTNLLNESQIIGGIDFGTLNFATVSYGRKRAIGIDVKAQF